MNSGSSDQLPQSFVNINWSRSIDHSGQLGSGFGSLMPSQSANSVAPVFGAPGNSSPKNFSKQSRLHQFQPQTMGRLNVGGNLSCLDNLDQFLADPGFAERAARFSSFDGQNYGLLPSPLGHLENSSQLPVPNGVPLEVNNAAIGIGTEDLSASDPKSATIEANNFGCLRGSNAMKRKSPLKSKEKDIASSKLQVADKDESNAKRPRPLENKNELGNESVKPKLEQIDGDKANGIDEHKQGKDGNAKPPEPPEPPKDYIHVRARRGQATDSHSLAERVRREKISQRMKLLQDLVPGCSKVTGKAVMLDEIINYVQSLQRQVEFLSMKLATVNPHLDFDNLMSLQAKDMIQICGTVPSSVYPFEMSMDSSYSNRPQERNTLHSAAMNGTDCHSPMNMIDPTCHLNFSALKSCLNGFGDDSSQLGALWDDDLQSVVHMGIAQSLEIFDTFPTAQMKAEL